MLDKRLFLSKKDKKFDFLIFLLRKEVRAVPDVPWVHMEDPPGNGLAGIKSGYARIHIKYFIN